MNNSSALPPTVACPHQVLWCEESFRSNIRFTALAGAVSFTLTGLTAVLSNGLLFAVYYLNEPLRRPANTILLALALTDFLTGAVVQPLNVWLQIMILTADCTNVCVVRVLRTVATYFLSLATLLTLSLCSLDRYLAVFHSFRYAELVTNERVTKVLLASWIGLVVTVISSRILGYARQALSFLCVSNVIFITVLYYKIYKEIRRLENDPVVAGNEEINARRERERKTAKTLGLILGFLFLSYVPFVFFLMLVAGPVSGSLQVSDVRKHQVLLIATACLTSNSTVNFFVYYWKNSEIREAILKVLKSAGRSRNNVVPPTIAHPGVRGEGEEEGRGRRRREGWEVGRDEAEPAKA